MKRIFAALMTFIFLLPGCAKKNNTNISTPDDIVIWYGISSYAMFGFSESLIRKYL